MQRGSDQNSAYRDDEMKSELRGRLQANRPTRAAEDHEPEPDAEDDPLLADGRATSPDTAEADQAFRSQLAQHLRRGLFPAKRAELLDVLDREHAPDDLVEWLSRLPEDQSYVNVQDVVAALGRAPLE